ncbi:MAG: hypothetical protein WD827_03095 [Solirubrobacterales bacterium]
MVDDVEPDAGVVEPDVAGEGGLSGKHHRGAVDKQDAGGRDQAPAAEPLPPCPGERQAGGGPDRDDCHGGRSREVERVHGAADDERSRQAQR